MDFSAASPSHEWTQIACTVVSRKVHTIYKTKRLGKYLDFLHPRLPADTAIKSIYDQTD